MRTLVLFNVFSMFSLWLYNLAILICKFEFYINNLYTGQLEMYGHLKFGDENQICILHINVNINQTLR